MPKLIKYLAPSFILLSGLPQQATAVSCSQSQLKSKCINRRTTRSVVICICPAGIAPTSIAKTQKVTLTHKSVLLYNNLVNALIVNAQTNRQLSIITYRLIWSGLNKIAMEEDLTTLQEYESIHENLLSERQKAFLNHHRKLMLEVLKQNIVLPTPH